MESSPCDLHKIVLINSIPNLPSEEFRAILFLEIRFRIVNPFQPESFILPTKD